MSYNYDVRKHRLYECQYCGIKFNGLKSILRVYCSGSCKGKDKKGGLASNWKGGKLSKKCEQCGKLFTFSKYRINTAKFCSRNCTAKSIEFTEERRKAISEIIQNRLKEGNWKNQYGGFKGGILNHSFHARNRYFMLKKIKGYHSPKEWEGLKEKHNFTCVGCGKKEPEIKLTKDHIISVLMGGTNWINNIQPLCKYCNSRKGARVFSFAFV